MPEDEKNNKINSYFIYGFIIFIIGILIVSLIPSIGLSIETSHIVLIAMIVILLLFRYFDVIEVPGFLKLNKEIKELQKETKEIKQTQLNMLQTLAITQSVNNTNSIIINATREAKQEAVALLAELPDVATAATPPSTMVNTVAQSVRDHVNRRNYSAAFLDLRRNIEYLVKDIAGTQDPKTPFYKLIRQLQKEEVISDELAESLDSVRRYANIGIHMTPEEERRILPDEVKEIVDLGLRVINKLEMIRSHQTTLD